MFYCPKCNNCLDKKGYADVVQTSNRTTNLTRRIRKCGYCGNKFSTTEITTKQFNSFINDSSKLYDLKRKLKELDF